MSSTCHFCGQLGHWKATCTLGIVCIHYRQLGHVAKVCNLRMDTTGGKEVSRETTSKGILREKARSKCCVQPRVSGGRNDGRKKDIVLHIRLTKDMIFGLVEGRKLCRQMEVGQLQRRPQRSKRKCGLLVRGGRQEGDEDKELFF